MWLILERLTLDFDDDSAFEEDRIVGVTDDADLALHFQEKGFFVQDVRVLDADDTPDMD